MSAVDASASQTQSLVPPRAGIILTTLILGAFVANINLSIGNVAIPDIGRDLGATQVQQTMVAATFTMGLAASVLYFGAIGDRYGRKKLLLAGAALSVPAALASAWAPNVTFLILARFIAGIAAGLMFPTTLSLISAMWRGAAQTKAIALWSGIGGGAAALGGVIGGLLLERFWWGSVFLFGAPLAVLVFLLAWVYVPSDSGDNNGPVDHIGGVLSVVMVASLILGLDWLPNGLSPTLITCFVIAIVCFGLFVVRQRRASVPLVDFQAGSVPSFWVAAVAGTVTFGCLMGAMYLGQQFTQNVLRYDTLTAALCTLPLAVMLVLTAPVAGRIVAQRGSRTALLIGFTVVLCGFVVMIATWRTGAAIGVVLLSYALVGTGVGLAATPAAHSLMASLPVSRAGMGSAFTDLSRDFGGAVMQSVMGTILAIVYADRITGLIHAATPAQQQELGDQAAQQMAASYQGAQEVAEHFPQTPANEIVHAADVAFTNGKSAAYLVAVVLIVASFALVAWKYPRRDAEREFFAEIERQNEQTADPVAPTA